MKPVKKMEELSTGRWQKGMAQTWSLAGKVGRDGYQEVDCEAGRMIVPQQGPLSAHKLNYDKIFSGTPAKDGFSPLLWPCPLRLSKGEHGLKWFSSSIE